MKSNFTLFLFINFNEALKKEGFEFFKKFFLDKAFELSCTGFEFFENAEDEFFIIGIGHWETKAGFDKFYEVWELHKTEFSKFFSKPAKIEFFEFKDFFDGKGRRKIA